jgi:hypothetical protein
MVCVSLWVKDFWAKQRTLRQIIATPPTEFRGVILPISTPKKCRILLKKTAHTSVARSSQEKYYPDIELRRKKRMRRPGDRFAWTFLKRLVVSPKPATTLSQPALALLAAEARAFAQLHWHQSPSFSCSVAF